MKHDMRAAAIACLAYTLLIAFFVWQAFFARTPNDAGMFVLFSALPTSLLADWFRPLRESLASLLQLPVNDRFAMSFDATLGWIMGCLQYGILAVVWRRAFCSWGQVHAPGA
jgi:hypothetical protein